jgi:hypothetical protein
MPVVKGRVEDSIAPARDALRLVAFDLALERLIRRLECDLALGEVVQGPTGLLLAEELVVGDERGRVAVDLVDDDVRGEGFGFSWVDAVVEVAEAVRQSVSRDHASTSHGDAHEEAGGVVDLAEGRGFAKSETANDLSPVGISPCHFRLVRSEMPSDLHARHQRVPPAAAVRRTKVIEGGESPRAAAIDMRAPTAPLLDCATDERTSLRLARRAYHEAHPACRIPEPHVGDGP